MKVKRSTRKEAWLVRLFRCVGWSPSACSGGETSCDKQIKNKREDGGVEYCMNDIGRERGRREKEKRGIHPWREFPTICKALTVWTRLSAFSCFLIYVVSSGADSVTICRYNMCVPWWSTWWSGIETQLGQRPCQVKISARLTAVIYTCTKINENKRAG